MSPRDVEGPPTLLAIPQELRDMILKELLFSTTLVHVFPSPFLRLDGDRPSVQSSTRMHPAILCTCKELHKQGVMILYGSNKFRVTDSNHGNIRGQMYATKWLDSIGSDSLANLTSITMHITGPQSQQLRWSLRCHRRLDMEFVEGHTKPIVGTFNALHSVATKLRHLGLIFDKVVNNGARYVICQVSTIKAIAMMKGLKSFNLSGAIPVYWLPRYLNRKLHLGIDWTKHGADALLLEEAIRKLYETYDASRAHIATAYPTATLPAPIKLPDFAWAEDRGADFDAKIKGALDDRHQYATKEHTLKYDRPLPDLYASGLDLFTAEHNLYSGQFWPPVNCYLEEARIEKAKVEFLISFWNELKDLGLLKRKSEMGGVECGLT
jgi:hypothetical protein